MQVFASRRRNRRQSARLVFTRTYEENQWGGRQGEYCSGTGSSDAHARAYGTLIQEFIRESSVRVVVDLGCGDFSVGRNLITEAVEYLGVDIVDKLVARNEELFGTSNIRFRCLDIIADPLPEGDLCLLRQVLQHLSNAQIKIVLDRVAKYRYVVITEHYPAPSVVAAPNRDKPHGADIRVYDNSAVYLDLPPFNTKIRRILMEERAAVPLVHEGEIIRTFLIENVM